MKNDGLLGATSEGPQKPVLKPLTHDLLPKVPPAPVEAKAMISMFMLGGPSQIDLFDPKPALYKWHGNSFQGYKIRHCSSGQSRDHGTAVEVSEPRSMWDVAFRTFTTPG